MSPSLLEERLSLVMESARLAWWDWDLVSGRIEIQGQVDCLLGFTPESLARTGAEWFDYVHPDDRTAVRRAVNDCLAGVATRWRLEHRFRGADGRYRWVWNSGRLAEQDPSNRPIRMFGLTKDIDAERRAEDELKRDALILSQLQDIVVYCDSAYVIKYVNDAFTRVLGIPRAEALDRPVEFRFPPAMLSELAAFRAQVLRGQHLEVELEDLRPDGTRVWIHWRAQPIVDERGQVVGIINVGTDIDARKRAELQKREIERKLIETQRMDTLGSLAGGIAHDFNNILSAIFGFTEIALARGNPDEQTRMTHRQVLKAAERARDLVKRILSFSRFHEAERRPIAPQELIDDAARFIRAALPSTIEMEVDAKGDWPPLLVDPHQLHQVLLNLATNAAHAVGERHGQFKLKLAREIRRQRTDTATGSLEPGDYLVIEASDNGSGMNAETKARIFDAFFTTKEEGQGTGLGLSVVSAIMRGHNGGVDVLSSVGVGTKFRLYLPITPGVQLPTVAAEEAYTQRLRGRGETLAIIDDEAAVGQAVERVLQSFGYQTTFYPSASKFLEVFSIAPSGIDLIVTDQTMPGMTGIEMAIRLREEGHELPVLIMTGFSKQLRPELVAGVGRAVVIRKPFARLDLGKAVRELLDEAI